MSYHHLVIALQSKLEEYINCDLSEVLERVKYAGSGSIKRKTVEVAPESPPSGEVRAQFAELSAKQELNLNSQRARDQIGSIIRALKFDLRQERALTAQVPGPSILEKLSNPAYRQKFISGGQEDLPGSSSSRSESVASVGETYFQELINIIEPYVSAEEALTWEQVDEEIADNFKVLEPSEQAQLEADLAACLGQMTLQIDLQGKALPAREKFEETLLPNGISWADLMRLEARAFQAELKSNWPDLPPETRLSDLKKVLAFWTIRQLSVIESLSENISAAASSKSMCQTMCDTFRRLFMTVAEIDQSLCALADKKPASFSLLCRRMGHMSREYARFLHTDLNSLELYRLTRGNLIPKVVGEAEPEKVTQAKNVWYMLVSRMLNYLCVNLYTRAMEALPETSIAGTIASNAKVAGKASITYLYARLAKPESEPAESANALDVSSRKLQIVASILHEHHRVLHSEHDESWHINWDAFHTFATKTMLETEGSGANQFNFLRSLQTVTSYVGHYCLGTPMTSWGERLQIAYREFIRDIHAGSVMTGCPEGRAYQWTKMYQGYVDEAPGEELADLVAARPKRR